jgi:hypothetical protein
MFGDAIEDSARRWIVGLMSAAGQPTFSYVFRQASLKLYMELVRVLIL